MSLHLSESFAIRLRDEIRLEPLQADEIRRIVGAGEKYIALSSASVDPKAYYTFFTCAIDNEPYTVYFKR